MPIPGSFRLYKIPLTYENGSETRERFVLHDAVQKLPCGSNPDNSYFQADSLWVLATHGMIKVPDRYAQRGRTPLCSLCSLQLSCASGKHNLATITDLPVIKALDLPRWAEDFGMGENIMVVDAPKLLAAPFDDPED